MTAKRLIQAPRRAAGLLLGLALLVGAATGCACFNFAEYGPQCCSACGTLCTDACIPICIDTIRGEGPLNVVKSEPEPELPPARPLTASGPTAVAY